MKRSILILLALLCMAGCADAKIPEVPANYSFTYENVEIVLHADAAPVISALGEPKNYTEEASCAFDGLDKTYHYGAFYLTTYPLEGRDYIYTLWFADDTVATAEGIRIGSTRAQVEQAYGTDALNAAGNCVRIQGQSRLVILLTDGLVSSVRYEAVLE